MTDEANRNDDPKFAEVVPGRHGWYWDTERTTVVRVTRDGSGTLWANWGDGCGSDRLPEGPPVEAHLEGRCACESLVRCAQRGVSLDLIRDELQHAVALLIRLRVESPESDPQLMKHVLTAHGIAMGVL